MFPTRNPEKSNDDATCGYKKKPFSPVSQISDTCEEHGVNNLNNHFLLKHEELTKDGTSL
ncbi:hypothetical protein PM082_004862 [Marasmius tenuissimus]|nr:hypothetical protein PM082_004862 [Marasmius tenuissimus]